MDYFVLFMVFLGEVAGHRVLGPPTIRPTRTPLGVGEDGVPFSGSNRGLGSTITWPMIIAVSTA